MSPLTGDWDVPKGSGFDLARFNDLIRAIKAQRKDPKPERMTAGLGQSYKALGMLDGLSLVL
jgi:hypothetical protein